MFNNSMKPVRTKDTQGTFGGDLPYRYVKTNLGACIVTTWEASLWDRLRFLFSGRVTVQTYQQTQPPLIIKVGEKA